MELGTSRSNQDFADLHNIDLNEPRLWSLSSGLTASDGWWRKLRQDRGGWAWGTHPEEARQYERRRSIYENK